MYIAIKTGKFILLNGSENQQELIDEGYTLYTESEYNDYVVSHNQRTIEMVMGDLEIISLKYFNFGSSLYTEIKSKVWAVNLYQKSIGNDMTLEEMKDLHNRSDLLERTLKSGSFLTSIDLLNELAIIYPMYATISSYAVAKLQTFLEG